VKRIAAIFLALASPAFGDSNLPPAQWANRQLPDARQEVLALEDLIARLKSEAQPPDRRG